MSNRIMSFQGRNRSGNPSQTARQEWVPRGSSSATTTVVSSSPASSNSTPNVNQASTRNDYRYRPTGRPTNHRRDREKERSENHVAVRKEIDLSSPQLVQEIQDKRPVNHRRQKERSENHVAVRKAIDPNLPQLVQEIQDKLIKNMVECMICYDMVRRSVAVWSCSSCYSIFHLNCIKKWARTPTSVDLVAEKNQGFNWRCPGCQSVQFTSSEEIQYVCYCGKRADPPPDLYLTPHSCGEPCGKPLEKELGLGYEVMKDELCPHVCVLQCHPGPCPPCKAFAPPRLCPCGKKVITTRCSDRKSVLTCGQQCDKLLECGRHRCERICHVGACDPCNVLINAPCFCKKKVEVVICSDMVVKGKVKAEDGIFSCISTCGKKLRCGNHYCAETCHPGPCGDCEFLPNKIKSCYCGKTSLQDQRKSCLDPIPTCSDICAKFLPCQVHRCDQVCHAGSCPPCLVLVTQKCLCGLTSRRVECYKTTLENERFMCDKPCGSKKNCGRHRCSERCCPLSNSNNLRPEDWDPHFCQMACGKKLRCGQHSCESLCHSGHCPPCLETIFTDLTCACGRTSIPPPLPCGTPPPSCQLPCSVPLACGHSSSHSCHFGDCPPCSVPVARECIGGHVVLRNIPCGSKVIRCNKLCGKTRQCGLHACGRTCHPAPCDASSGAEPGFWASCGQICGAPRRDCRHTCIAPCHPSAPCPDVRCDFRVTITCSCGRLTATVPCDAGGCIGGFNADTVFEACIIQKLPSPLQPVESTGKKVPLGQRKLMCDDECAKLERKRVLVDAFDIANPNLDALHFGENSVTSELIFDLYRRDPKWVLAVEERCKFLVLGKHRGTTTGLKVHVFCPMLKDKRDAVSIIAERWKLAISAAGWEPKRFIVVHVTPKSKPPGRIIGSKGSTGTGTVHPPVLDALVDMNPRLVVSFLDLPREADISALVLRFGGECELVWLNDKNALAVFSDPARAATAMRRLDHGSIYTGAATFVQSGGASAVNNAWGGTVPSSALRANPWKKPVTWGGDEAPDGTSDLGSAWKGKDAPIAAASINHWSVLDSETGVSSSSGVARSEDPSKLAIMDSNATANSNSAGVMGGVLNETESSEVVDDWEKSYE